MAWKCVFTTRAAIKQRFEETGIKAQPGEMWLEEGYLNPDHVAFYEREFFSAEYMRDWRQLRAPLFVILPSGDTWCMDQRAHDYGGHGWTVTGEPPLITASPSILVPAYHGWLREGVLTDDIDRRTYPAQSVVK